MSRGILLVDNQVDVRRLLHSALNTLKHPEIEIFEAASGNEAAAEFARRSIHLLVAAYALPDMTGLDLMQTVRLGKPDIKAIMITSDGKKRDELLNDGAAAVFDKPVPLGDFLDAVERSLGLGLTIFPANAEPPAQAGQLRVSDLLANLRQDIGAEAALLINARGLVVARAGDVRDSSMEVSLISALTAVFSMGLKAAKSNRQEGFGQFSVFAGGDQDLILMAINAGHALLLAGKNLSNRASFMDAIQAMQAARVDLDKSLRSLGAESEPLPAAQNQSRDGDAPSGVLEMEELLKSLGGKRLKAEELNLFWDQAARNVAGPASPDSISYEEARNLGLTRDEE